MLNKESSNNGQWSAVNGQKKQWSAVNGQKINRHNKHFNPSAAT
jgi:hypothetical protein